MTTKEKCPSTGIEGTQTETPLSRKQETAVPILADQATNIHPALADDVAEFAAEVRRMFAEHATPITSTDDPRVAQLVTPNMTLARIAEYIAEGADRQRELGELWFSRHVTLPAAPASIIPAWGTVHSVRMPNWPEVEVSIDGAVCNRGAMTVSVETVTTIAVEDSTDPDGTPFPAGVYADTSPTIIVDYGDSRTHELPASASAVELRTLGELLIDVARDLGKVTP